MARPLKTRPLPRRSQGGKGRSSINSFRRLLLDQQEPEYPWEFIQIGNCGSPLETDEGWIVLTHGVGFMRKHCIGAILLDLKNPAKIIARLDEPLLAPH